MAIKLDRAFLQRLFTTDKSWTGFIARVSMAIVLFPHGAQKMLGVFGGHGFAVSMQFFTRLGIPGILGLMVILIEFVGSLCLLIGLATRAWALLTILMMIGIVFLAHVEHGFFMNWAGDQQGEGFEFFILMIGLGLASFVAGGGRYALDHRIRFYRTKRPAQIVKQAPVNPPLKQRKEKHNNSREKIKKRTRNFYH